MRKPQSQPVEIEMDNAEMVELSDELHRLKLPEGMDVIMMKTEVLESLEMTPPILILPSEFIVKLFNLNEHAYHELLSTHLPKIIDFLRPQGQTLLLAYSLLNLSRSWRNFNSITARSSLVIEAIQIFKQLKGKKRLGRAYLDLAVILKDTEHFYDALFTLSLSEKESEKDEDYFAMSCAWYHRSVVCRSLGHYIEAIYFLNRSEQYLSNKTGSELWIKRIVNERIPNQIYLDRFADAKKDCYRLLDLDDDMFMAHFYLGDIERLSGDEAGALLEYERAAKLLSIEILQNQSDRFQIINRTRHDFVYRSGLLSSVKLNKPKTAFSLLQLSKTDGLDIFVLANQDPQATIASDEVNNPYAKSLINKASQALLDNDELILDEVQAEADWHIADREIKKYFLNNNITAKFELENISATMQSMLDSDTVLIEFFNIEDEFWTIAVGKDLCTLHQSTLSRYDITMLTYSFRQERNGLFQIDSLNLIGNALLLSCAGLISQKNTVVIAQNDLLAGIPFHAMEIGGNTLMDTHKVSYVSSFFELIKEQSGSKQMPSVSKEAKFLGTPAVNYAGVESLPGIFNEAVAFSKHLPQAEVIVNPPAVSTDIFNQTPTHLLHIACHGEYDNARPLLSRLLLADRPVFAFEILLTRLKFDIVILTACKTAESIVKPGGYTDSIASTFIKAGVKNVIAALWPVDDNVGANFTDLFYEAYVAGNSVQAALRSAQQHIRRDPRFEHPHFWAPFILLGLDAK